MGGTSEVRNLSDHFCYQEEIASCTSKRDKGNTGAQEQPGELYRIQLGLQCEVNSAFLGTWSVNNAVNRKFRRSV